MNQKKEIPQGISNPEISNISNNKEIMTMEETMAYLGYSRKYLNRLCYYKRIPYHKPTGKKVFFLKKELEIWVSGKDC